MRRSDRHEQHEHKPSKPSALSVTTMEAIYNIGSPVNRGPEEVWAVVKGYMEQMQSNPNVSWAKLGNTAQDMIDHVYYRLLMACKQVNGSWSLPQDDDDDAWTYDRVFGTCIEDIVWFCIDDMSDVVYPRIVYKGPDADVAAFLRVVLDTASAVPRIKGIRVDGIGITNELADSLQHDMFANSGMYCVNDDALINGKRKGCDPHYKCIWFSPAQLNYEYWGFNEEDYYVLRKTKGEYLDVKVMLCDDYNDGKSWQSHLIKTRMRVDRVKVLVDDPEEYNQSYTCLVLRPEIPLVFLHPDTEDMVLKIYHGEKCLVHSARINKCRERDCPLDADIEIDHIVTIGCGSDIPELFVVTALAIDLQEPRVYKDEHAQMRWAFGYLHEGNHAARTIQKHWRRDRAARVIQRAWRIAVSDPSYRACRSRLEREFNEILN